MLVADGGGKVPSILKPRVWSRSHRAVLSGVAAEDRSGIRGNTFGTVNSGPGMLTYRDGQLVSVASVSIEDDRITAIYSVSNPEKIQGDVLRFLQD